MCSKMSNCAVNYIESHSQKIAIVRPLLPKCKIVWPMLSICHHLDGLVTGWLYCWERVFHLVEIPITHPKLPTTTGRTCRLQCVKCRKIYCLQYVQICIFRYVEKARHQNQLSKELPTLVTIPIQHTFAYRRGHNNGLTCASGGLPHS